MSTTILSLARAFSTVLIHQARSNQGKLREKAKGLLVDYGHDWIEGNYEIGHTLWLPWS